MSGTDSSLVFAALFKRALGIWPESIDVAQLHVDCARPDLYVVIGLGTKSDSIAEELSGQFDTILMMGIHDAISSTVRSAALFSTEIKLSALRQSTVRENFEKRLHRAATNQDLGWGKDDILLAKQYFTVNEKIKKGSG